MPTRVGEEGPRAGALEKRPAHKGLLLTSSSAARFRRLFGTGVRSSKCRDTVGVKCS